VYHRLPYPDGVNGDGMLYSNAEIQRGAMLLFKPSASAPEEMTTKLKGVWPDETCAVLFQDWREQLMHEGLTVSGTTGEYASDIVWIQVPRGPASSTTGKFMEVAEQQQGAAREG